MLPSVLGASLEAAVARSDDSALARDCERECADLRRRLAEADVARAPSRAR